MTQSGRYTTIDRRDIPRDGSTRVGRGAHALGRAIVAFACFGAALASSPAVEAQEPLHLSEAYREARSASPRLAAAEALARAAQERIPAAGRPPDPELQLGWMNYTIPGLTPMPSLGMTQIQLMQMLPLGGKLASSRRISEHRATAEWERAGDAGWEVRSDVAMAFYGMYEAARSLAVMRESLRLLEDIKRTAESMYRVGEGRQTDVLRAQVEIARMTEDTLRMQAMLEGMSARLNAALDRHPGSQPGAPVLPRFPTDAPSVETLIAMAYSSRPMLKAGAAEVSAAAEMTRLARKELLPDLRVGVQYGQRGAAGVNDPMGSTSGGTERMGSLMLGVTVPVFARSRQLPARQEAEAMRAMAASDLAAMQAETRARIGETHADLVRSRRLTTLYVTTILPQAEATASSALSAYRVGQVDFMTLLDSRMTAVQYRRELATLEADQGRAWAELEMLVGSDLIDAARNDELADEGAR
jgi:outer membrane protein, heavy metal efflux system